MGTLTLLAMAAYVLIKNQNDGNNPPPSSPMCLKRN